VKLSMKMSRLNLSSRQIINLMGYVNNKMRSDDLSEALSRINGVAMKMSISQESKNKLHHFLEAMRKNISRAPLVYGLIFLCPGLETYQKIYSPIRVIKEERTVTERMIRQHTVSIHLEFYPTKDYFDLIKSRYSGDCTDNYLGERQLMASRFFNVRIFRQNKWTGNIYMLDYCDTIDSLIIDRIQIPRGIKASYHRFFDYLKEVLIEMFEDVHYGYILVPLKISNHGSIQKSFHRYKEKLSSRIVMVDQGMEQFESVSAGNTYYVLHHQ